MRQAAEDTVVVMVVVVKEWSEGEISRGEQTLMAEEREGGEVQEGNAEQAKGDSCVAHVGRLCSHSGKAGLLGGRGEVLAINVRFLAVLTGTPFSHSHFKTVEM